MAEIQALTKLTDSLLAAFKFHHIITDLGVLDLCLKGKDPVDLIGPGQILFPFPAKAF